MKAIISKKTKDYLKYACGEILLVTLGILLAFAIDNWKEDNNKKDEALKLYTALLTDLELTIEDCKSEIDADKIVVETARNYLLKSQGSNLNVEDLRVDHLMWIYNSSFNPAKTSFVILKSGSKIDLIDNNGLLTEILKVEAQINDMIARSAWENKFNTDYIDPVVMEQVNSVELQEKNKPQSIKFTTLESKEKFSGLVNEKIHTIKAKLRMYYKSLEQFNHLKSLLENSIRSVKN